MKADNDNIIAGDLLLGANAIADFLGISKRAVYRLKDAGILPFAMFGGKVGARRSRLTEWMEEAENAEVEKTSRRRNAA